MSWHRIIALVIAFAALAAMPVRAALPMHGAMGPAHAAPHHSAPHQTGHHGATLSHQDGTCPVHADMTADAAPVSSHDAPGGPSGHAGSGHAGSGSCCSIACAAFALPVQMQSAVPMLPRLFLVRAVEQPGPTLDPVPPLRPPKA